PPVAPGLRDSCAASRTRRSTTYGHCQQDRQRGRTMGSTFGEVISGLAADGKQLESAVFNENEVRAAAGLTMVAGAVAFVYAYFDHYYVPLQSVSIFFFVEFLMRVTLGLKYSPTGL